MPVYNAADYVCAAIDSVLAQTRVDVEVIAVDDGSDDGSLEILSAIGDPRVIVVSDNRSGAAAARNRAFRASRGSHVLFLDADDLVSPNHLSMLHDVIANDHYCVAHGEWDRFWTHPREATFPRRETYIDASGPAWLAMDWMRARPMMQCGMFLMPRELIVANSGWDERLSLTDDFEFFARIISRSAGVRHAHGAKLYYRSGISGSLSRRKDRKAVESQFLAAMLGTGHLVAAEDSALTRLACANVLQSFDYEHYPHHAKLRAKIRARVAELGGSSLTPDGSPAFQTLRRFTGWKFARRAQRLFAGVRGAVSAVNRR